MAMQSASGTMGEAPIKAAQDEQATEFPVREYIGAMALELAQMARWDGDEALGRILESAATLAAEPLNRPAPPPPETGRRRPA
ncbi:hypothetical protein [Brevundimonas sp. NIBR11]|uniref:hypothetical protein n=1 Tax=Brevundimonas sp. NIBR11 TaxID=3015999 RepID=UPI0022F04EC7|nr:hypothetical protein [Brevundimonas sp. NIBR11]WGM31377.1 hypothetical protein KKHFBJBL_01621 [Brevundimonas sp. NIBR11]